MNRNRNIDVLRGITILLIVVYHCIAITGAEERITSFLHIKNFIMYGGEIGVTLFFIMSGLGIAYSIYTREQSGSPYTWLQFIKKRAVRIAPQYYFCIFFLLLLTTAAGYLSTSGVKDILSHIFFVHNFSIQTNGSINGVLWTMGVIVQFYLVAYPLYFAVKKKPILTGVFSIVFTVVCKFAVFSLIDQRQITDSWYYFIYGRQLLTSLDNFVLGMVVGYLLASGKGKNTCKNWIRVVIIGASIILVDVLIRISNCKNRLANTKTGWIWYSCLALVLCVIVWNFAKCNFKRHSRILLWISKYEYGIYLWHLVIIRNLFSSSLWIQELEKTSIVCFILVMIVLSCVAGFISTIGVEDGIMKKFQTKN